MVRHPYGMATVVQLFRNNATLCTGISDRVVTHTLKSVERQGRQETFLQFLRSVIKVNDVVQRYSVRTRRPRDRALRAKRDAGGSLHGTRAGGRAAAACGPAKRKRSS